MLVNSPPDHQLDDPCASIRLDARLDATTRAKVDDLARYFGRPRAAVLCHIMHWGLVREPMDIGDQGNAQGPVHHLYCYVDSHLYAAVRKVTTTARVTIAPWLRHMVRQITVADFPGSWREERLEERSHDSRDYGARFMLRLDAASETTLQRLAEQFHVPRAAIIRQLLAQATPDTFPTSWHLRVAERHGEQVWPVRRDADHEE
jgi:predicted transcriptional regulator